ncbi:MAG: TlyA family RNA methyltransferase [Alphaproteobacteria bacterium]|nr:TlyA family RNA methyltransferase [Alphaproteobacteria bacterium]
MSHDKRADLYLVEYGFYESRARAQAAIAAGPVRVNGEALTKASRLIEATSKIEAESEHPYVSCGGVKFAAALDHFEIDPNNCICLDIGSSTGGFTDCLLKCNARFVHAVDVGHDQFHDSLRNNTCIHLREGCDARVLTCDDFDDALSLIVVDVSFISLTLIIPKILSLAAPNAFLIALIKPQFEVGRAALKKGLVREDADRQAAIDRVTNAIIEKGWSIKGVIPSPIAGGDGNLEYLVAAEHHS